MDKLKQVDWRGLARAASNKVKQYTLNLSDLEVKVEEATNRDTWGPHGSVMTGIAEACYDFEGYKQVMGVLARRLQERDENWRMCYKALLLLEFLIKHGPTKVVSDTAASMSVLERLQRFEYRDANGRDHGTNVRHRAKEIATLVNSPDRVREEREKARANRAKYQGVSAAEMRAGGFGGSTSGFGGGSGSFGGGRSGGFGDGDEGFGSTRGGGYGSSSFSQGGGGGSYAREQDHESGGYGGRLHGDEDDFAGGGSQHHIISKRPGSGPVAADAESDAVAATRARIDRMKLSSASEAKAEAGDGKKRLADVRVNPKIAQSLGLKVAAAAPRAAAPAAAAAASAAPAQPASAADLLGGLLDEPAPAPAATSQGGGPLGSLEFDAFGPGGGEPGVPVLEVASPGSGGGWDAFGGDSSAAPTAPAAAAADPFAALAAAPPAATGPFAALAGGGTGLTPPPPPAPAAERDPFAALVGGAAPTATSPQPMSVNRLFAGASPAVGTAAAPPALSPSLFASPPAAGPGGSQPAGLSPSLQSGIAPADMFGDLAGPLAKPAQPSMGAPSGLSMAPRPLDDLGDLSPAPALGGPGLQSATPVGLGLAPAGVSAAQPAAPGKDPFADLLG